MQGGGRGRSAQTARKRPLPALASISNSDTVYRRGCIPLVAASLNENSRLSLWGSASGVLTRDGFRNTLGSISSSNCWKSAAGKLVSAAASAPALCVPARPPAPKRGQKRPLLV